MSTALIMAGGRSLRMRSTASQMHKALVPVLGVPMIERNLCMLLSQGFRDIIVAVNSKEWEIVDYVRQRGADLAHLCGASLRCYKEETPLGTIGAAGVLVCHSEPLLVVNVDNLTTLNLTEFVQRHTETHAAFSIATHLEHWRIPFGEVVVNNGFVTEYREKPTIEIRLSSGTYVLSADARRLLPNDRRTDVPDFFALLSHRHQRIVSYEHNAAWIDVNDAASVEKAEQLILRDFQSFEHWARSPDSEVAILVLFSPSGILLKRPCPTERFPSWRLPAQSIATGVGGPEDAIARIIDGETGCENFKPDFVMSFDNLELSGHLVRSHVFTARTNDNCNALVPETEWLAIEKIALLPSDRVLSRSISAASTSQ
jgi:dTDP-glucose pyrophosphorylase